MQDASEHDTSVLLVRARGGDRTSLDQLLQRYHGALMTRIRLMMGEEARRAADSVDFLQGAFVEVMEDLSRYELKDETAFLRWATRIARNNIRDQVRRRRERALETFASDSGLFGPSDEKPETPSRNVMQAEQVELLVEGLARLNDAQQEAIELHWLDGLPFAEVARRTGRSEDAARVFHSRALLHLGRELKRIGAS